MITLKKLKEMMQYGVEIDRYEVLKLLHELEEEHKDEMDQLENQIRSDYEYCLDCEHKDFEIMDLKDEIKDLGRQILELRKK